MADNFARPGSDGTIGSDWTTPMWSQFDEVSPDDATTSRASVFPFTSTPNGQFIINLLEVSDPLEGAGAVLRFRARATGGSNAILYDIEIRQSTTVIATLGASQVSGDSWVTKSLNLSQGELDNITDFSDLNIRFVHTGTGAPPAPTGFEVTWMELEVPATELLGSGGYVTGGSVTPVLFSLLDDVVNHSFTLEETNGSSKNMARSDFGVLVTRGPWQEMADVELDLQEIGSFDGMTSQGETQKPLFFTAECLIEGTTNNLELESARNNMIRRMKNLKRELKKGLLLYKFDRQNVNVPTDLDTSYFARLNGPINVNPIGNVAVKFQLNLVAPSGSGVASVAEQQIETIAATSYGFNLKDTPAVIDGNHPADVIYTYKNLHASPVTLFVLTNTTRGEQITWTGTISQNDLLRVDTARRFIDLSTDGGATFANAMAGLTDNHDFPLLEPDVVNVMEVLTDQDDATLTVDWRSKFI